MVRRHMQSMTHVLASLVITGAITLFYYRIFTNAQVTTIALTFLLAIFAVAAMWGFFEAIVASASAVLCSAYFFLPPIGTFRIGDPQNRVALFAFMATSVVASQLSTGGKRRGNRSVAMERETESIVELSERFLIAEEHRAHEEFPRLVAQLFELKGVALFDRDKDQVYRSGNGARLVSIARLRDGALDEPIISDPITNVSLLPLVSGERRIGSLFISGGCVSGPTLRALAKLAAVVIQRPHTKQNSGEMSQRDAREQNGRAVKVEEQIDVETEDYLQKRPIGVSELVESALGKLSLLVQHRKIQTELPPTLPDLYVDPELASISLRQLLGSAMGRSDPKTPITIKASAAGRSVRLGVQHSGRIGDGYRIARDIALVHGGAITVCDSPSEGSEVVLILPSFNEQQADLLEGNL